MRKLEQEFPDALVVVGVHAGKFTTERDTQQIRLAAQRLGVRHPIVNDRRFRTWRRYSVQAWPTLVFIGPDGRYLGSHAGEAPYEGLRQAVADLVADGERRGDLVRRPGPEGAGLAEPRSLLRFPSNLAAGDGGRVFVADTGHDRVVLGRLAPDGSSLALEDAIGCGQPGHADGRFDAAAFSRPHGLALDGRTLYVADTGNHAIRAADLEARVVRTVAGTGRRMVAGSARPVPALQADLASPWDLALDGRRLYVAMAGSHQLWVMDLAAETVAPLAGSGAESIDDGILGGATLAQPSALARAGDRLYFADAESSAVRWADLATPFGERAVHTVVGTGLFEFGDRDGEGDDVRLQHPTALAVHRGRLLVADTYNHRVKVVEPARRRATTLTAAEGCGGLNEPEGLLVVADRLYIADTNHHRLVVADLPSEPGAPPSCAEVAVQRAGQ